MTRDEAAKTLKAKDTYILGNPAMVAILYDCPDGYAVVSSIEDQPGIYFILTEYHVNILEDLHAMVAAPPIVRLDPATVAATAVNL